MKKNICFIFILLFSLNLKAQLQENVEIEILGKPSWQQLIPMKEKGLILFLKTDHTKAKVLHYDQDLKKIWEKELFLDVERAPTAYTFDSETATFLFRETSGMYYQLFTFNLSNGDFSLQGFELRDYFVDQDYVFLKNKLLIAGSNLNGAAFYEYDLETEKGKIIDAKIPGSVQVQEFKLNESTNNIESLWSVKTIGYSNEKKKKGAYTKDSFLEYATFNFQGEKLNSIDVKQKAGNFPLAGRVVDHNGKKMVLGTYQSNAGDKGLFFSSLSDPNNITTYSYSKLLTAGASPLNTSDLQAIYKDYNFLMNEPVVGSEDLIVGGVFYKPEYRNVSEQVYDPNQRNDPYNRNSSVFGRSNTRTQTRRVFAGISYPVGLVLHVDENGELKDNNKIDINQLSQEIKPALSYNASGSVAYCTKGSLAAKNFNIGSKPIIYKLSNDSPSTKSTQGFIPAYTEVKFWYKNYFIAEGSKSKIEVVKIEGVEPEKTKSKRKNRRQQPPAFTQIRKTIYLTKVSSGD